MNYLFNLTYPINRMVYYNELNLNQANTLCNNCMADGVYKSESDYLIFNDNRLLNKSLCIPTNRINAWFLY